MFYIFLGFILCVFYLFITFSFQGAQKEQLHEYKQTNHRQTNYSSYVCSVFSFL